MADLSRIARKLRRAVFRNDPGYYDMYLNRGERYFARLYLHQIRHILSTHRPGDPLLVLDAGCQAGRLAVPLAQDGHRVTGVDTSAFALRRLTDHAREAGISLRTIRADLTRWLPTQPPAAYDVALCAEVLYLRKNYRALLDGLIRVLKPGGVGFVSHRPRGYYLAEALRRHDPDVAHRVLTASEGVLWGSYYNWQDWGDLEALYGQLPVEVLAITPIGPLSWIAVNPETLDDAGQEALFRADLALQAQNPGLGRYLLVTFTTR